MKKNRIIFRADGDLVAGYGHVIRSLSLASILKKKYNCCFVIRNPDSFLKEQIIKVCDEIIEIPENVSYEAEAKKLAKNTVKPDDIVVLDGYHFSEEYQSAIKRSCFKVVCIDDICDRHFFSDAVINHGEGIKPSDYSREFYTKLYLGTAYIILRKSFLKKSVPLSQATLKKHRVFINMGGTDQQNYTKKALSLCLGNKDVNAVDIVLGSYYSHIDDLRRVIVANKNISIKLHSNLTEKQMVSLMKRSSIGITSASTVSYEYSSVGGVLFVFQTVMNQKNIYSFLISSGSAFPAESFNKKIQELSSNAARKKYFENRGTFFSGNSPENLRSVFDALETERDISIRKATKNDLLTYFKWANDPEVRQNAINNSPIPLENHSRWFSARLKSKNALLFLLEKKGIPMGQVRFDKTENSWEIDYSIDKKFRGKGFGEIILKHAILEFRKKHFSDDISAKVKHSNTASNRVFEKLNFTRKKSQKIGTGLYDCYLLPGHR